MRRLLTGCVAAFALQTTAAAAEASPAGMDTDGRARLIVLTDIGNEPDDSQSLVRLLVYANELDIEGLVATTSIWQRDRVQRSLITERIAAYGEVVDNLRVHAEGYPDEAALMSVVRSGVAAYGMDGVGDGRDTEASRLIVEAADRDNDRALWISVWGGAADLAQALWTVRATRSPEDLARFVARLRVYSISDQDDAGPWIRRTFPQLFWIASVHGWNNYPMAAWYGISGDINRAQKWPDADMVSDDWRAANIELGPLGSMYPKRTFIMEGDTPALLHMIPNGLGVLDHPEYGGWGGRYSLSDPAAGHYGDVVDEVVADDGAYYRSNQATVFRWRAAFQRDFAARIAWTMTPDFSAANHSPVLRVAGVGGDAPILVTAKSGDHITLDADGSTDPDGSEITYRWWHYIEPSLAFRLAPLAIADATTQRAVVAIPAVNQTTVFHVILEATDSGSPSITRYRRVMIQVNP